MEFHKSKKDILNGNVVEQIILFSIPAILGYLLQEANSIVDNLILGRLVGSTGLAAIGGSAKPMIDTILNFIMGLSSGAAVLIAFHYGRGETNRVHKDVKTSMFICFLFGGIFTIIGFVFGKTYLTLMGTPTETIEASLIYIYFYFSSFIPYMIYQVGSCILRAIGDTKKPFILAAIQCGTKIVFDVLLAGIFKLGVFGTSLATFLSNLVAGIVVLIIFAKSEDCYEFRLKNFGFDKDSLKQVLKYGLPSGIQNTVFAISCAVIQLNINVFGADTVAAHTLFNTIDNIYWSFTNAVGVALITLIGQNYGARKIDRVKLIIKYGIIIELIGSITIGFVNYSLAPTLVNAFTQDQDVIVIGTQMLRTILLFYWPYSFVEVYSAAFKSCGKAIDSMVIVVIGSFVFRLLYLFLYKFETPYQVLNVYTYSWALTGALYIIANFISFKIVLAKNN